jgi:peptidoglycan/xylan/chitin deacetylase (PgdA/CDA1 family)
LENSSLRGYLRELAYLLWRLPIFFFARSWVRRTHFTLIHYHRMSPDAFRGHIEYLARSYTFTPLKTLAEALSGPQKDVPKNSLTITFDDGWRSNYDLLPVIRESGCPITIFLSTGLLGTNRKPGSRILYDDFMMDEDLLQSIIRGEMDASSLVDDQEMGGERTMLSADEVGKMKGFIDFQSHGVSHHVSTAIPLEAFRYELRESKKFIEELTGREVYAFAYPYNRAGRREAEAVEEAGYTVARVGQRMLNSATTNRYMLNSIPVVKDCSVPDLRKNIEIAEMKTAIHFVGRRFQRIFSSS